MKQTMGQKIAQLRKEKAMTQAELAEKMGVTDKAVSKWERDLSCPDVTGLPKLAELLGVTLDDLMQVQEKPREKKEDVKTLIFTVLKAIPVAMGVAVTALTAMKQIDTNNALSLLGIGLTCAGLTLLQDKQ